MKFVRQREWGECLLACMAMIASSFGREISLVDLRREFRTLSAGSSLQDAVAISDRIGLQMRAVQVSSKDLHHLELPCILHWNDNHFVVLSKAAKGTREVYDPAIGVTTYTEKQFADSFSGIAVEFSEHLNQTYNSGLTKGDNEAHITSLFDVLKTQKAPLAKAVTIGVVSTMLLISIPIAVQISIDEVIASHDISAILPILCLLLIIGGASTFFNFAYHRELSVQATKLSYKVNANLMDHVFSLPYSYMNNRPFSRLVEMRIAANSVANLITQSVPTLAVEGLFVLISLVVLLFYSPVLAAIVAIATLLAVFIFLAATMRRRAMHQKYMVSEANVTNLMHALYAGLTHVKAASSVKSYVAMLTPHIFKTTSATSIIRDLDLKLSTVLRAIKLIEFCLILYFSTIFLLAGTITIGMLYSIVFLRLFLEQKITVILPKLSEILTSSVYFEVLDDLRSSTPEQTVSTVFPQLARSYDGRFNNVSLRFNGYAGDILHDISFDVPCGQVTAICGPSGSGKSSLLKIAIGLLEPSHGSYEVNGSPLTSASRTLLQKSAGTLLSEHKLFPGTIVDNIASFANFVDEEAVMRALDQVSLTDEILNLPLGQMTPVDIEGGILSSGQLQRVKLARAIYDNPRTLILDEPTSHLDSALEEKIFKNLRASVETILVATHSTVIMTLSDKVYELKDGSISLLSDPLFKVGIAQ